MSFPRSATIAVIVAVTVFIILLNRNDDVKQQMVESVQSDPKNPLPFAYDNKQANESSVGYRTENTYGKSSDQVSVIQDEPIWKNFEGYHFGKEGTAYATYDDATIKALAFQGDIEALHILAQDYAKDGDYASAKVLYFDAAARGSNAAFRELAIIYAADYERSRNQGNSDDALIAMMVVDELLVLVGDKDTGMNSNIFRMFNDINLTTEKKLLIQEGAANLYNELNDYRASIGVEEMPTIPNEVESTRTQNIPDIPDVQSLKKHLRDIEGK